jgi:hypothetical protein
MKRGISLTVFDPADGPQAVALDEHRYDVQEDRAWGAQCCKERALVCPASALTGGAAKASFSIAVYVDVIRVDLAVVGAKGVVTPMNYPAASCEVSNPRWRVAMARQFGGEILGAACTA